MQHTRTLLKRVMQMKECVCVCGSISDEEEEEVEDRKRKESCTETAIQSRAKST